MEKVLENEFMLGEIIHKVGSSRSFIRASAVNRFWLQTAKSPPVLNLFLELNNQSFLGFIVETQNGHSRSLNMLYPGGEGSSETVMAMRAGYDHGALGQPPVIASKGALVLQSVEHVGELPIGYFVSCPFSRPASIAYVGFTIPKIPKDQGQYTVNTFGQFGVLMRTRRDGVSPMGFFVKEPSGPFAKLYNGVRFGSRTPVYVHVSVYSDVSWTRHVSPPLDLQSVVTFHRNPYSVIVGSLIYLMYLVKCIVCFDLDTRSFRVISLPDGLDSSSTSWFDYTVAKASASSIALVHFNNGVINKWILNSSAQQVIWQLEESYNIMAAPGGMFNLAMHALILVGAADWGSVQLRCASEGARFILVTVGMNEGIFIVDMLRQRTTQVPNVAADGMMGRVFQLGESWPPIL